jgi:diguanylate cyclase (GGDEF)-like protein
LWGNARLVEGNMWLVELPVGDIAYFALRLVLGGLVIVAAVVCLRFARQARREHWPWRLATAAGILLSAGCALSVCDAIDNVVLRPHDPVILASWTWFFLFDLPLPILALLLIAAWRERDLALAQVLRLSVTDALTGALNRRGFLERAATSIVQARRAGLPAALIMFDIDHFKAINDSYGHPAGDEVLCNVAKVLTATMRPGDLLGRIGGEEFAVFLWDSTVAAGIAIADRLRNHVRTGVTHPAGAGGQVTVSGGVAPAHGTLEPEIALSLTLTVADEALYAAKRAGRDRILGAQADITVSNVGTAARMEEETGKV